MPNIKFQITNPQFPTDNELLNIGHLILVVLDIT